MQQLLVVSARKSNDTGGQLPSNVTFARPSICGDAFLDQQLHECVDRSKALTMSSSSGTGLAFLASVPV